MCDCCPICLEKHEGGDLVTLPCHHQYGYFCVSEWFQSSNKCPLCSMIIIAFEYEGVTYPVHEPKSAPPSPLAPTTNEDLLCLDHNYFAPEIDRLLLNVEIMESHMHRQNRDSSSHNGSPIGRKMFEKRISKLNKCLTALLHLAEAAADVTVAIEPLRTLESLYSIERQLRELSETDPFMNALWEDDMLDFAGSASSTSNFSASSSSSSPSSSSSSSSGAAAAAAAASEHGNSNDMYDEGGRGGRSGCGEDDVDDDDDDFVVRRPLSRSEKKRKQKQKAKIEKAKQSLQQILSDPLEL